MTPDDRWRVQHMIEAATQALDFVRGHTRSSFEASPMLRFALMRAVEVVGEAASRVSEEGRAECPAIPWAQIVGMRNRLVHAYFEINEDILWDTVQLALPPLLQQLEAAIARID